MPDKRLRKSNGDTHQIPAILPNRLRSAINAGKAISQMNKCIEGKVVLDNQQVACIRIALNKVLPDAVQPKDADHNGIKDVTHVPTWKLLEAIDGEVVK